MPADGAITVHNEYLNRPLERRVLTGYAKFNGKLTDIAQ